MMRRFMILAVTVATASATLSAGIINTPVSLAAANISHVGWGEGSFAATLYDAAITTGPFTGGVLTDTVNNISFTQLNDSSTKQFWADKNTGTVNTPAPASLIIPVNIYDATDVWTIIGNLDGAAGAQDTSVTFNWSQTAGGMIDHTLTIVLTNSGNTSTPSGQIQSTVQCTSPPGNPCLGAATGPVAPYTSFMVPQGTDPNNTNPSGVVGIVAQTLFSAPFTAPSGLVTSTEMGGATAGNVALSEQGFFFNGLYEDEYLQSIQVNELSGVQSSATVPGSSTSLLAITVGNTPEPASIWLGITGLVMAVGVSRLRRSKVSL